jgi:predicted transcriptional regulator
VLLSRLLWKGQLAYVEDVRYYRRYFAQRSDTQAERITGKKQTLSRADFVQHYLDDFAKLGKGVLNAAQGAKLKRAIKDMLAERFGA